MRTYRTQKSGFTLVEILIVVIILGILAAIVIPQFTNASEDARESSLRSTLQTLRSQVELYKLQHLDLYPTATASTATPAGGAWVWDRLTMKTNEAGTTGTGNFGPYLQQPSQNSLRAGVSGVVMIDTDGDLPGTPAATDGFVFSRETGKIWAYDRDGAVFVE